jgi:hypothetical protein
LSASKRSGATPTTQSRGKFDAVRAEDDAIVEDSPSELTPLFLRHHGLGIQEFSALAKIACDRALDHDGYLLLMQN